MPLTRCAGFVARALLTLIALGGCSSSTEPASHEALITSTVSVSTSSANVGEFISAQWVIENVGDVAYHHSYGLPHGIGYALEISVTPTASVLEYQRGDVFFTSNDSLNLAPHAKLVLTTLYRAKAVGRATVHGCLPPDSTVTEARRCVSTDVRVISGF